VYEHGSGTRAAGHTRRRTDVDVEKVRDEAFNALLDAGRGAVTAVHRGNGFPVVIRPLAKVLPTLFHFGPLHGDTAQHRCGTK